MSSKSLSPEVREEMREFLARMNKIFETNTQPRRESTDQEPVLSTINEQAVEDESDTSSEILELDDYTAQDDDEDQWFCTLCDKCKSLIKDAVDFYFATPNRSRYDEMPARWWHNINYLQEKHDGCDLCTVVLAGLLEPLQMYADPSLAQLSEWNATLSVSLHRHEKPTAIMACFNCPRTDPRPEPFDYGDADYSRYCLIKASAQIYAVDLPRDEILRQCEVSSDRTDSCDTVEKIIRWLRNCAAHDTCGQWCRSIGAGRRMPSRLLEIDTDNSCHNVRLVITDGRGDGKRPYVTLSHCWGGRIPARLLSHNFEQMTRHIPFDDLPPTFQDAISVTYRLGFRYLWIDALCIIQDSPEDWLAQSKTMADIYANCSLNIAATASEDSTGGLFRDRCPKEIAAFTAHVSKQTIVCYRSTWNEDVKKSMLINRAWVLQERFLAPRVVHFCHQQVHWDCIELSTSETLPDDFNIPGLNESHGRSDDSKRISTDKTLVQGSSRNAIYRLWDQKMEAYSFCALTFPSDRSVAVLGLSHAFAELLGLPQDDGVFGMWKTRFVFELMWWHVPLMWPKSETCVRVNNKVPSWSWCSVTSEISNSCWTMAFESGSLNLEQHILSVLHLHGFNRDDLSPASEDSTVKLSGPMCEATLQSSGLRGNAAITLQIDPLGGQDFEIIGWDDKRQSEIERIAKSKLYLMLGAISWDPRERHHYAQTPAFIQAINAGLDSMVQDRSDNVFEEEMVTSSNKYMCLLLKPTGIPAHFERVGYVAIGLHTWRESSWEDRIARWLKDRDALDKAFQAGDLPSHLHEGMDEYGRYRINLV